MVENSGPSKDPAHDDSGGMGMMLMMMACCMGILLVFLIIPLVGWPIGLAVAGVALVAMFYGHQKLMGHGRHH